MRKSFREKYLGRKSRNRFDCSRNPFNEVTEILQREIFEEKIKENIRLQQKPIQENEEILQREIFREQIKE